MEGTTPYVCALPWKDVPPPLRSSLIDRMVYFRTARPFLKKKNTIGFTVACILITVLFWLTSLVPKNVDSLFCFKLRRKYNILRSLAFSNPLPQRMRAS